VIHTPCAYSHGINTSTATAPQAEKIRAEFAANAALDDPNQVERALIRGEQRLVSLLHPDPYIGAPPPSAVALRAKAIVSETRPSFLLPPALQFPTARAAACTLATRPSPKTSRSNSTLAGRAATERAGRRPQRRDAHRRRGWNGKNIRPFRLLVYLRKKKTFIFSFFL
jgi:hypothetical protein